MEELRKTVFISYSWDTPKHQEWILKLATDLMKKFGVNVLLDQFDLSAGKDLTHFMETAIVKADKVLVILTPNYKIKAENREKGVGYETSMISKEIFESPISVVKFIPILRTGNQTSSSPKFLSSKIYLQMTDDSQYINKLYELFRIIYDKPLVEKPVLGPIPDIEKPELLDPIMDMAKSILLEEKINNELNQILNSMEGAKLYNTEIETLNDSLKKKVNFYSSNLDLDFEFESDNRLSIVSCSNFSVVINWTKGETYTTIYSELSIRYFNQYLQINARYLETPKPVKTEIYKLDLNYNRDTIWKSSQVEKTITQIEHEIFLFIIESIANEKSKNFRK